MIPGVTVNFDGISEDVIAELQRGHHAKDWFAAQQIEAQQAELARANQGRPMVDGLGQPGISLNPFIYHAWARKFGSYDCWQKDGDLTKYLTKHFDSVRVQHQPNTNRVGYTAAYAGPQTSTASSGPGTVLHVEHSSGRRFTKVYGSNGTHGANGEGHR